MTLRPSDMLQIQSAIDEYEKKFPRRPAPTAEEALAWRFGTGDGGPPVAGEPEVRRIRLGWFIVRMPRVRPALADGTVPAVRKIVRLGWWGAFALGTASVFLLGAFVGGFK